MTKELFDLARNYTSQSEAQRLYLNIGGEMEARAVEARLNMSAAQRKEEPFYETLLKQEPNLRLEDAIDPRSDLRVVRNRKEIERSNSNEGLASIADTASPYQKENRFTLRRVKNLIGFDIGITEAGKTRRAMVEKRGRVDSTVAEMALRV